MYAVMTQFHAGRINTILQRLKNQGNLLFYKNFLSSTGVNADFSAGSGTGTFARSTSATNPCTYIDQNGVINLVTTSNIPRYPRGYYDETGFHLYTKQGIRFERDSTNYLTRTDGTSSAAGIWSGWADNSGVGGAITRTVVSIPELTSVSGATSQRIQYVSASDTNKGIGQKSPITSAGSIVNGDVLSISVYFRSQTGITGLSSMTFSIRTRDSSNTLLTTYASSDILGSISTDWRKFSFQATITDATSDRLDFIISMFGVDTGDSVDIEMACVQVEKRRSPTSWIPTKTTELTRNVEYLTYLTAGNLNASEMTIFVQYTPDSTFANDGVQRSIFSTATKRTIIKKTTSGVALVFRPNEEDSIAVTATGTTTPLIGTNYTSTVVMKHSSPYASIYNNGASEATYTTGDWTEPTYGTTFSIGSDNNATHLNGLITSVAIFSVAKSATDILKVYNILK